MKNLCKSFIIFGKGLTKTGIKTWEIERDLYIPLIGYNATQNKYSTKWCRFWRIAQWNYKWVNKWSWLIIWSSLKESMTKHFHCQGTKNCSPTSFNIQTSIKNTTLRSFTIICTEPKYGWLIFGKDILKALQEMG